MTALFHFEEKKHRKNLSRAETISLLFPLLLSQVLEHLGFSTEPQLERRRVCEAVFIIEKWHFVPGAPPLPIRDPVKDQPPPIVSIEEPHIPTSTVPSSIDPLPVVTETPVPLVPAASTGPSTSALPMDTIPISPHDFLAIMTTVRTFAATSVSFATSHAALA